MKTRSVKYYLMLAMLVILIGAYIGMTFLSTSSSSASDGSINNGSNIDDLPLIDPDDEKDDDDNNETSEVPDRPIDIVNYALNIYNNGEGSASTFTYAVKNTTPKVPGVNVTQYVKGNILRNKDANLEECYFYYDDKNAGEFGKILHENNLLKVGYRSIYTDEGKQETTLLETPVADQSNGTFDMSAGKKQTFSKQEAKEKFVVIHSMEFPLLISDKTCSVKQFDTKSSKTYYTITLSYNVAKLPEAMDNYYHANSSLARVSYTNYEYEFTISKRTGKLAKMVRTEKFISYALGTIQINSTATFTQVFSAMDKAVIVARPQENIK